MKGIKKIHRAKGKKFLLQVETSENPKDYLKYEELRYEIWGDAKDTLPGARNMWCENFLHEGSSLFIAVYAEDEKGRFGKENLVGFSYGFVGVKDKAIAFRDPANLQFYSQYTGVRPDFQHFGLGVMIKEFQREMVRDVFGIFTVTCTFDPLTAINAHRNIHHFGMEVASYREAPYGDFEGFLNRADIPCDRFFVCWDLKRKMRRPDYDLEALVSPEHLVTETALREIKGRNKFVTLEIIKKIKSDFNQEFLLVEIPYDFYLMLQETDVPETRIRRIPLNWRLKTRQAFQSLFQRGYTIIDFRRMEKQERKRHFYVLKKQ